MFMKGPPVRRVEATAARKERSAANSAKEFGNKKTRMDDRKIPDVIDWVTCCYFLTGISLYCSVIGRTYLLAQTRHAEENTHQALNRHAHISCPSLGSAGSRNLESFVSVCLYTVLVNWFGLAGFQVSSKRCATRDESRTIERSIRRADWLNSTTLHRICILSACRYTNGPT